MPVSLMNACSAPILICLLLCACPGGDGGNGAETPAETTANETPAGDAPFIATSAAATSADKSASQASAREAYELGRAFLKKGVNHEAADAFRRAVSLDAGFSEAHFALGRLLLYLSDVVFGTETRDPELLEEGVAALKKASELEPTSAEYAYWAGHAFFLQGKREEAIERLHAALALDSGYALAVKELALVHADAGEAVLARDYFEKAVALLPDDPGLWFQYGIQLEGDEDVAGARGAYERAIELDWTVPSPYTKLAVVLERLGDTAGAKKAIEEFERWSEYGRAHKELIKIAKADPKDAEAQLQVALHLVEARRHEYALPWFARALEADPATAGAHLHSAKILHAEGRIDEAQAHFDAARSSPSGLDPRFEELRAELELLLEGAAR